MRRGLPAKSCSPILLRSKDEPDGSVADAVTALIYSAPHTELKGKLFISQFCNFDA